MASYQGLLMKATESAHTSCLDRDKPLWKRTGMVWTSTEQQTCPGCASPLVLFNERFGDTKSPRRSENSPENRPGNSPQDKTPTNSPRRRHGRDKVSASHGGWYCSRCGVHIIPDQPSPKTSPRSSKTSRSMEDLKQSHKGEENKKGGSTGHSPRVRGLDEHYEDLETQLRNSFLTLISHMREHFEEKEQQLKEYQIDLCQREKILRANEEHVTQRISALQKAEQSMKNKLERLNLYKESMLSQLEARKQQLARYEQSMRLWESRARAEVIRAKKEDVPYQSQRPEELDSSKLDLSLSSPRHVSQSDLNNSYQADGHHRHAHRPGSHVDNGAARNGANGGYFGNRLGDHRQSWSTSQLPKTPSPPSRSGTRYSPGSDTRHRSQTRFSPLFVTTSVSPEQLSRYPSGTTAATYRTAMASERAGSFPQMSVDSGYTSPNRESPYQKQNGHSRQNLNSSGSFMDDTRTTDSSLNRSHHGEPHGRMAQHPSSSGLDTSGTERPYTQRPRRQRDRPQNGYSNSLDISLSSPDSQRSFYTNDNRYHVSTKKGVRRVTEI